MPLGAVERSPCSDLRQRIRASIQDRARESAPRFAASCLRFVHVQASDVGCALAVILVLKSLPRVLGKPSEIGL